MRVEVSESWREWELKRVRVEESELKTERERQRERQRETERDRERQREKHRETERESYWSEQTELFPGRLSPICILVLWFNDFYVVNGTIKSLLPACPSISSAFFSGIAH